MARFNARDHQVKAPAALATSPLGTVSAKPDTRTFEGAQGWSRTPQTELFLMASGAFLDGKGSFYEGGAQQDGRLRELVTKVALEARQWCLGFGTWLRGPGNIRSAAVMFAADFVKISLDAGVHDGLNRRVINAVLQRADEPGELLAYWTANYGRRIPKPVKRGVADAVRRLYNQRSLLKYDTASHAYRFGDVINLCHPTAALADVARDAAERIIITDAGTCPRPDQRQFLTKNGARSHIGAMDQLKPGGAALRPYACVCTWWHVTKKPVGVRVMGERDIPMKRPAICQQGELFQYALDRRHNQATAGPTESLGIIRANADFRSRVKANPALLCDPSELYEAAMTWEDALTLAGQLKVGKRKVWEAMIPSMNIMALIRNLRNFDEAGVSDEVAQKVIDKLADPEQIAKSRQLPFRFLAAHRATSASLRWAWPLEKALNLSLSSVPRLGGRTLILVDRSPSMFPSWDHAFPHIKKSDISRADQAAVFGAALALRAQDPTLVWFGGKSFKVDVPKGGSVLKLVDSFGESDGTDIPSAVKQHYASHDCVIILTDEQTRPGYLPSNMWRGHGGMQETSIDALIPQDVPVFMWNFAGYTAAAMPSGKAARFTMGGLSDGAFALIPRLLSGMSGDWPWEHAA